jgi:hypothetical protein
MSFQLLFSLFPTENEMGVGVSGLPAQLSVHYPPLVALRMEPATPVTETEHRYNPRLWDRVAQKCGKYWGM